MAFTGSKAEQSAKVFAALVGEKKESQEKQQKQSQRPPVIALLPPPDEGTICRLAAKAGVDYVTDTLQVGMPPSLATLL